MQAKQGILPVQYNGVNETAQIDNCDNVTLVCEEYPDAQAIYLYYYLNGTYEGLTAQQNTDNYQVECKFDSSTGQYKWHTTYEVTPVGSGAGSHYFDTVDCVYEPSG